MRVLSIRRRGTLGPTVCAVFICDYATAHELKCEHFKLTMEVPVSRMCTHEQIVWIVIQLISIQMVYVLISQKRSAESRFSNNNVLIGVFSGATTMGGEYSAVPVGPDHVTAFPVGMVGAADPTLRQRLKPKSSPPVLKGLIAVSHLSGDGFQRLARLALGFSFEDLCFG